MSSNETPIIAAIDIGTHKVSVLVGKVHAPDNIEIIGMAHAPNKGMRKGSIVSLDKVIAAIKSAVAEAEEMSKCRINSAWVAIPSTDMQCYYATGRTVVLNKDKVITTQELNKILNLAQENYISQEYYVAHTALLGFHIDDGDDLIPSPLGLTADSIQGHYQLMMLPINAMQNFDRALKGANIGIERQVISSLATAEACLLKDEKEYGVCLLDIGAGTTNICAFLEGRLIMAATFPFGGEHVTRDIATMLQTTTEEAERLKTLHGCVDLSAIKPDQLISIQSVEGAQTISRIELAEIIIARYQEIILKVRQQLEQQGLLGALHHGVVLTGEACKIEGMIPFVRQHLNGMTVHLGNAPAQLHIQEELAANLRRPIYATAAGLLLFSQQEQPITTVEQQEPETIITRIKGWFQKITTYQEKWF